MDREAEVIPGMGISADDLKRQGAIEKRENSEGVVAISAWFLVFASAFSALISLPPDGLGISPVTILPYGSIVSMIVES